MNHVERLVSSIMQYIEKLRINYDRKLFAFALITLLSQDILPGVIQHAANSLFQMLVRLLAKHQRNESRIFFQKELRKKDEKQKKSEEEFEQSDLDSDKDGLSDEEFGDKPKKKL